LSPERVLTLKTVPTRYFWANFLYRFKLKWMHVRAGASCTAIVMTDEQSYVLRS